MAGRHLQGMTMDPDSKSLSVTQAKAHFFDLLARVETGEAIVITRRGKAVARLVPEKRRLTVEERLKAHQDWIAYRKLHKPTLGPDLTIKDLINEGRR
jgi:prevent-host-death family protein